MDEKHCNSARPAGRRAALAALAAVTAAGLCGLIVRQPLVDGALALLVAAFVAAVVLEREAPAPRERAAATHLPLPRILIVGAGAVGRMVAEGLEKRGAGLVVGFVDDEPMIDAEPWVVLGGRRETAEIVRRYHVDEVILAYAPTWQQRLAEDLLRDHPTVRVGVVPSPYEALMRPGTVESAGDIALVKLMRRAGSTRAVGKRAFDLALASLLAILLSPVALVIAVAIRLTSRGSAIFRQERVGLRGRPFTLLKFRTMVADAEAHTGPILSSGTADQRLTCLGRFLRAVRLDELPQLWNVIRGDMSLVGPRPERPHFVREFERDIPGYGTRHDVRPGLTGLAQVYGTYHTDARDKLRFDLIYLAHQSAWLDITILLRTLGVMARPRKKP